MGGLKKKLVRLFSKARKQPAHVATAPGDAGKPQQHPRQAVLYVECPGGSRSSSAGGATPGSTHSSEGGAAGVVGAPAAAAASGSGTAAAAPGATRAVEQQEEDVVVWHDCCEHWAPEQQPAAAQQSVLEQLAALPLPQHVRDCVRQYLTRAGVVGCKPAATLLHWMQDSGTSLAQLRAALQPVLERAAHVGCGELAPSVHEQRQTSEDITRALRRAQQGPSMAAAAGAGATRQSGGDGSGGSSGANTGSTDDGDDDVLHLQLLQHLVANVELVLDALRVMARRQGVWVQVARGAMDLWYGHDAQRQCQMILATCVLPEPLEVITALTREVDLVPQWNPCMSDMMELGYYSATELLVYVLLWMPWPLPLPVVVLYALGVDLLDLPASDGGEQPCVLVACRSQAPPARAAAVLPQCARATTPMAMDAGGFRMRALPAAPDGSPRTEVSVLVSVDASRFHVPDSVISTILKVVAPLIFKSVVRVLQRLVHGGGQGAGSAALLERIALRPEYATLRAHVRRLE